MAHPYAGNSGSKLLMNTGVGGFGGQKMMGNMHQNQGHNMGIGGKGSGLLGDEKFGMKQGDDTNFLLTQLDCGNGLGKSGSLALGSGGQGGMGGAHYNDPLNFHMGNFFWVTKILDNKSMNLGGLNDPNRRI